RRGRCTDGACAGLPSCTAGTPGGHPGRPQGRCQAGRGSGPRDRRVGELLMAAPMAVSTSGGQYLSFTLGGERYGIDILKVQEIRSYEAPTPMPNSSGDLLGVVNLRGVIVPIHDLRLRFG